MNWGHKLTIVIILFMAGMLGMVIYASLQTNEMFDDYYYEKELAYQGIIDAKQNLINISSDKMIHQVMDEVIITFPAGTFEKLEHGTIELLRNDAKNKDALFPIRTEGYNRQSIPKNLLHRGMYKVRITWSNNHTAYYREESLFVE